MIEFYTKLFVDINISLKALVGLIANICDGQVDLTTVELEDFEIDIGQNEYAEMINDITDFMSFKYTVEVVNKEDIKLEEYLLFISNLMLKINSQKAKVVAACDWEEMLPGKGKL